MLLTLLTHFMLKIVICAGIYRDVTNRTTKTDMSEINPNDVLDNNLNTRFYLSSWFAVEIYKNTKPTGVIVFSETEHFGAEIIVRLSKTVPSKSTFKKGDSCGTLEINNKRKFQFLKCVNNEIMTYKYVTFERNHLTTIHILEVKIIADVLTKDTDQLVNKPVFTNDWNYLKLLYTNETNFNFTKPIKIVIDLGDAYMLDKIEIAGTLSSGTWTFKITTGNDFDYFEKNVNNFKGTVVASTSTDLEGNTLYFQTSFKNKPARFISIETSRGGDDKYIMHGSEKLPNLRTILWIKSLAVLRRYYLKDYVGCFRSIDSKIFKERDTIEGCISLCRSQNAEFAAIKNKTECSCVAQLRSQPAEVGECDMLCDDFPCGSEDLFSVYHTEYSNETKVLEMGCFLYEEKLFRSWAEEIQNFTNTYESKDCNSYCYLLGFKYNAVRAQPYGITCICSSSYPLENTIERSSCIPKCNDTSCRQTEGVLYYKTCMTKKPYIDTCTVLDTYHCNKKNVQIDRFCGDYCYTGFVGMLCNKRMCVFANGGCAPGYKCVETTVGLFHFVRCLSGTTNEPDNTDSMTSLKEDNASTKHVSTTMETVGDQFFTCPKGYKMTKNDRCEDLDECQFTYLCGEKESCLNTEGSYSCVYLINIESIGTTQKIMIVLVSTFASVYMIKLLIAFVKFQRQKP